MVATGRMVVAVMLGRDLDVLPAHIQMGFRLVFVAHRDLRLGARKKPARINNKRSQVSLGTGHRRRRVQSGSCGLHATAAPIALDQRLDVRPPSNRWPNNRGVDGPTAGPNGNRLVRSSAVRSGVVTRMPSMTQISSGSTLFPDLQPRGTAAVGVDAAGRSRRSAGAMEASSRPARRGGERNPGALHALRGPVPHPAARTVFMCATYLLPQFVERQYTRSQGLARRDPSW